MDCEKCRYYSNNGKDELCEMRGWDFRRTDCPDFQDKSKPKTNADRLRSMTDEELAILLANTEANFPPNYPNGVSVKLCETSWLDWLKQEVEP